MDFEFAFWQMIYLFVNPKKLYRNFQYRKQTKNQFARDDPAFLVLLSIWFIVSATGLSLVLHLHALGFIKFLLWMIFIDCILIGVVVATLFWFFHESIHETTAFFPGRCRMGICFRHSSERLLPSFADSPRIPIALL